MALRDERCQLRASLRIALANRMAEGIALDALLEEHELRAAVRVALKWPCRLRALNSHDRLGEAGGVDAHKIEAAAGEAQRLAVQVLKSPPLEVDRDDGGLSRVAELLEAADGDEHIFERVACLLFEVGACARPRMTKPALRLSNLPVAQCLSARPRLHEYRTEVSVSISRIGQH